MRWLQWVACGILFSPLCDSPAFAQENRQIQEEAEDHFKKWLNEDVVYLISQEERAVFEGLTTPDEKEQFIEQFWFRRDPDPRTAENEFKLEHYRRIAYANDHFTSGLQGWRTDRGRVYIIHGPPAEIESHASAGAYSRPMNEGGGTTSTFPFEVWTYRHIDGVGDDVVLEFVDPSLSGEYRLALQPEEKDALLYVPGEGLTMAEELGVATRRDRSFFNPLNRTNPMAERTARDNPFYRYETYTGVQAPREVKYRDLRQQVDVNVRFDKFPFRIRTDYFRLSDTQVLVPVTVQIEHKDLTFETVGSERIARTAVYGIVTGMTSRVVAEFEEDLLAQDARLPFPQGLLRESAYQKLLVLESGKRYKLTVIVKDLQSNRIGSVERALVAPSFEKSQLAASSVILASSLRVMAAAPEMDEMFVIGDVKVRPNLSQSFAPNQRLGLYFQVYNAAIDQSSNAPSLRIAYDLFRDGKVLRQLVDREGQSIQYFSDQRVVLVQALGLEGLESGRYSIRIDVKDQIINQSLELNVPFSIEGGEAARTGGTQ